MTIDLQCFVWLVEAFACGWVGGDAEFVGRIVNGSAIYSWNYRLISFLMNILW